ncbi:MAG: succinylglutamate desuccinylase [Saprospiraceae bacterium]|jgi:succinylglutamate desuccinylase
MDSDKLGRIISRHGGDYKGPLLIVIGALHGNEVAGVEAIRLMKKMLDVEPITNPSFKFQGSFVGLIGNVVAYQSNERYIDNDLNRIWTKGKIRKLETADYQSCEAKEQKKLIKAIKKEIKYYDPTEVIILDLHTTSSDGGIFTIPTQKKRSIMVGNALHAPVITGMLADVKGTMLSYYSKKKICGSPITGIVFEAGQHEDPLSINRAIAAITNCMKVIGNVHSEDVENIHDKLLIAYSKDLPKQSRLLYKYTIVPNDEFRMRPGYQNFQPIKEFEILADDKNGPVHSPMSGRILMPLYQAQGSEGFYIIREESSKNAQNEPLSSSLDTREAPPFLI